MAERDIPDIVKNYHRAFLIQLIVNARVIDA